VTDKAWRLRDPIHGLIVFKEKNDVDRLAWNLIGTPEFQRLRRIRQLGVSELVFPGATHTRFAHSVGVFHNARQLMKVIETELGKEFDKRRERVVLIAALLHDLGHGPFSHAFENARKSIALERGEKEIEKHEKLTAHLILDPDGGVNKLLREFDVIAKDVADLIQSQDPSDIYHAVVSSSFDADRLDYIRRDRYMTGTGAGSIDCDWLMDSLSTDSIGVRQDDEEISIPTFTFRLKGRQAAEDFLLARYRLYTQVYLHKTTRGFEKLIGALFREVGRATIEGEDLGLRRDHPLVRFLSSDKGSLDDFRELDDTLAWSVIRDLRDSPNREIARAALRLWNREPLRALDITEEFGHGSLERENAMRRLPADISEKTGHVVFRDDVTYNLYSGKTVKEISPHKRVYVRDGDGNPREITAFPDTVIHDKLMKDAILTRFYFFDEEERSRVLKAMKGR